MYRRTSRSILILAGLFLLLAGIWLACPAPAAAWPAFPSGPAPHPTRTAEPTPQAADGSIQVMAALAQVRPAGPAPRLLRIDQSRQMMYVYEGGVRVRAIPVSTGQPTTNTLTHSWRGTVGRDLGAIRVLGGMYVDYAWFLYPDLYGNILIHSVPYVREGGAKVYDQADALGLRLSSHGCIRISPRDAAWLKEWDPAGAQIQISAWPGPIRVVTP